MKTKLYSLLALPAAAMFAPATATAQEAFVDEAATTPTTISATGATIGLSSSMPV